MIYKATIEQDSTVYIGSTEGTFKTRYGNHKKSFKHTKYDKETTLSVHVWDLKKQGLPHWAAFGICELSKPYVPGTRRCALCTAEKVQIQAHVKKVSHKVPEFSYRAHKHLQTPRKVET